MATVALKTAACLPRRYLAEATPGALGGCMPIPFGDALPSTLIDELFGLPVAPPLLTGHFPFFTANSCKSLRNTRGLAVKALAGKGLFSVAVEVGRACPPSSPQAVQLLEATKQLANGDLTVRAGLISCKGEIGQLADTFDQMAESLEHREIEKKRAEEALRQSEERFARFMQHLPGLAWIKDRQGRYVYVNDTAEEAFSTPREKLYGRTDLEVFPPEVAEQFRKNDEQALVSEKGMQTVETLLQEDGIVHYSLVTKFPIPGSDGETALIGGTAFDITERLQAEEAQAIAEVLGCDPRIVAGEA